MKIGTLWRATTRCTAEFMPTELIDDLMDENSIFRKVLLERYWLTLAEKWGPTAAAGGGSAHIDRHPAPPDMHPPLAHHVLAPKRIGSQGTLP